MKEPEKRVEIGLCACHDMEHSLILELNDDFLMAHVCLNHFMPWWKRVYYGVKYILGSDTAEWDYWLMSPQDARRFRMLLYAYERQQLKGQK